RTSTVVGSIIRAHPTCTRSVLVAIPEHARGIRGHRPDCRHACLPEHMHASRNATGKTPGTWAGASEQAVEAPHLPERAKTPRRPALEGFEALGDAGLESASACGLGAEGPCDQACSTKLMLPMVISSPTSSARRVSSRPAALRSPSAERIEDTTDGGAWIGTADTAVFCETLASVFVRRISVRAAATEASSSGATVESGWLSDSSVGHGARWTEPVRHHDQTSSVTNGMIGANSRS